MRKLLALAAVAAAFSVTSVSAMDGPDHDIFMSMSEKHMNKTIDMLDMDEDGMISKDEFVAAMTAKAARKAAMEYDAMNEGGEPMMKEDFMKAFTARVDK